MGVHGIVDDLNKLQLGELPEEELRALEADLTGKVLIPIIFRMPSRRGIGHSA